jgi:trans-aconitate methyltransferase
MTLPVTIDAQAWLARWDAQQAGYLPDREERFSRMLDLLAVQLPPDFTAVDLCCGPGSISQRLLARFPAARCIAVDYDPALLALGQAALGDHGGRLRWVDHDLSVDADLHAVLDVAHVDAVLSTTALHWLEDDQLSTLYHRLAALIRPGGLLLNGDNLSFTASQPTIQQISDTLTKELHEAQFTERGVEDWEQWWAAFAREPGMEMLLSERQRRFGQKPHKAEQTGLALHENLLHAAGFAEVGVIWRHLDNCIVLAVR